MRLSFIIFRAGAFVLGVLGLAATPIGADRPSCDCHILDHEDLGMMEVVEVVEPEGSRPLRGHRH
jgi:hypothetical protein